MNCHALLLYKMIIHSQEVLTLLETSGEVMLQAGCFVVLLSAVDIWLGRLLSCSLHMGLDDRSCQLIKLPSPHLVTHFSPQLALHCSPCLYPPHLYPHLPHSSFCRTTEGQSNKRIAASQLNSPGVQRVCRSWHPLTIELLTRS